MAGQNRHLAHLAVALPVGHWRGKQLEDCPLSAPAWCRGVVALFGCHLGLLCLSLDALESFEEQYCAGECEE